MATKTVTEVNKIRANLSNIVNLLIRQVCKQAAKRKRKEKVSVYFQRRNDQVVFVILFGEAQKHDDPTGHSIKGEGHDLEVSFAAD